MAEIGRAMGRHRSTVGRELRRHTGQRGYGLQQAQRLANERRVKCLRPHKMMDPEVHRYAEERLNHYWSPDQIAGIFSGCCAGIWLFCLPGDRVSDVYAWTDLFGVAMIVVSWSMFAFISSRFP